METKILDPNTIAASAATNSGIANTKIVYDESDTPNPIFTINPTPDTEPDNENKDSEDGDEDNDDENDKVEEVEPPEEDITDPISIYSGDKGRDDK